MTNSFDRNSRTVLLAATSLSWLFLMQPALAQDRQAAAANQITPTSAVDTEQLQEVVVIADKQEIDLQRAPESITALSAATLDVANIVSPDDLNGFVPGLTLSPNEGENRVASIRGIGNEANQNGSAQPGVAYHVDGVYIASPYALSGDFPSMSIELRFCGGRRAGFRTELNRRHSQRHYTSAGSERHERLCRCRRRHI